MTQLPAKSRTNHQPYRRPPMTPRQALAIARYALLSAIDLDRNQGGSDAIPDLREAAQVIERLKQTYSHPEETE